MKYMLIGAVAALCVLAFNVHTLRGITEAQRAALSAANKQAAAVQSEAAIFRGMIRYRGEPVMLLHVHN